MNTVLNFYIVRHGQTLMNKLERVQGWCDSPLTQEGIDVAKNLGLGIKDIHFDLAYSSDLRRSSHTAKLILQEKGQHELPVIEMEAFKECCFGSYESGQNKRMWTDAALYLQFTEPSQMSEAIFRKQISSKDVIDTIKKLDTTGMAEDFNTLEARTQKGLRQIAEAQYSKSKDQNILIVAHGMSITVMLQNMGGWSMQKRHLENASVCKVVYKHGVFTIESMGDMSYANKGKEIRDKYNKTILA